jgi:NADH-quinone oxidoreductase subunit G
MRILPRVNEAVNEEWISDKTRHIVDGLRTQRLDRPYIRDNGKLRAATWAEAFSAIAAKVAGTKKIGAIAGDLAAVEEMFALKQLLASMGSANLATQSAGAFDAATGRASYIFNPTIAGIEQADALLIVGANPRKEAAVLNARIRKAWRTGALKVGVIGEKADLTYRYDYLGAGTDSLAELAAGKNAFADVLKNAKHPIVLVGAGVAARADGAAVLAAAAKLASDFGVIKDGWNGFAVLQTAASTVGALDIGFAPTSGSLSLAQMTSAGSLDVLFSLGADDVKVADGTFVVYIGTHGDRGAHRADVILPGAAYTEKSGIFVNTEGRVQMAERAGFPPGDAREDWAVIRALSDVLGHKLPYDSLAALRQAIFKAAPHLMRIDQIEAGDAGAIKTLAGKGGTVDKTPFKASVEDFYLTNPIARASAIMAECSRLASGQMLTAAE